MKIEVNIAKGHFWAIVGMIVLLFSVTVVIAKTMTPAYTADQPFHETLYADIIAGKTANRVAVDDDLAITGRIYGQFDCRIVENEGAAPSYVSVANCAGDEWLVSGGGVCENGFGSVCPSTCGCSVSSPNAVWRGYTTNSQPTANGWVVDCYTPAGGDTCSKAYAICCKKA